MRIHRQHGLSGPPAGQHDVTTDTWVRRFGWRRRNRGNAQRAPGTDTARGQAAAVQASPGETVAAAMQLAIALLTAGLDSAELEAWAADALTPDDADGLANLMIGLHVVSALLLNELHEATGEPSAAILQKLAILAEYRRGTPSTG